MKIFARAVVALSLVSLPASALTASKTKGTHHHTTVAPSEAAGPADKTTKHHHFSHKTAKSGTPTKSGALASHHLHKDKAPVAAKTVPAVPLAH